MIPTPTPHPVLLTVPASADDVLAAYRFLAAYRRNRRVALLLVDRPDDPALQAQQAALAPHAAGLAEQDIVDMDSRSTGTAILFPSRSFACRVSSTPRINCP